MCRTGRQLKKLISLKYLILETPFTFSSIFSWYFIVLHTLNFQGGGYQIFLGRGENLKWADLAFYWGT